MAALAPRLGGVQTDRARRPARWALLCRACRRRLHSRQPGARPSSRGCAEVGRRGGPARVAGRVGQRSAPARTPSKARSYPSSSTPSRSSNSSPG